MRSGLFPRGEALGVDFGVATNWYEGKGLYPLQAMVQPIALRFKYHFQGSRNTNRVDKVSRFDRVNSRTRVLMISLNGLLRVYWIGYTSIKHSSRNISFRLLGKQASHK